MVAREAKRGLEGLDISGVLSVIFLVLLLPPNSPHPPLPPSSPPSPLLAPFTRSEPAHVHPPGARVRRVAWRPSTAPAFASMPLASFSPLGRHTKCGRLGADGLRGWLVGWLVGWVRMETDCEFTIVCTSLCSYTYVYVYLCMCACAYVCVSVYANASFPCWAMILYLPMV